MRSSSLQVIMLSTLMMPTCMCQSKPQPAATELCAVVEHVDDYQGKRIRLKAFLGAGAEQDVLYDPECRRGEPLVYVSLGPEVSGQIDELRRIVAKTRSASVILEGTLHGPEPVKVDPNLPDWMKDRFKDSVQRYGHLDSLEMMIEVDHVVEASEAGDARLPRRSEKSPKN